MDNNTIIGYNILAKRAIETESGVNIDEALKRITAYRVVRGEGEDNHPASDVTVSTKILYFTKSGDEYIGWFWVEGEGWVCAGSASVESWKAWSEQHGSSSTTDDSVYVGPENTLDRSETYVLGKNNSAHNSRTSADMFAGTDIVMLGTNNSSEDGANVYQLGRDNRVVGNNLNNKNYYPKQVAVNIGIDNQILANSNVRDYGGEGVNIGKSNTSEGFSIAIGQNNTATGSSIVIGENLNLENGSNYARTAIGHAQKAYTVSSLQYAPALNGYPIGKYELLDFRNFGRSVDNAWFDSNGKPIELKRYSVVVNTNTDEVKFEDANSGYYINSRSSRYGYIDDNGLLVSTDDAAPAGKIKATYIPYYSSRNSSSYFWGTTNYSRYVKIAQFTPVIWQTYKLSEVEQYLETNSLGNVYISENEAYAKPWNNDFILYKVRVTGKEVNGSFIPWFNNNFDLSECTTMDFYPSSLSYSSNMTINPVITLSKETCGTTLEDLSSGSTLFGSLAKVEYGALGVTATHSENLNLNYTALPGYKTVNSTRYYLDGSSYSSDSYTFCSIDNPEVLTPAGILEVLRPIVRNGGVGIAAMTGNSDDSIDDYSNFSTSLEVSYGALGIGDRMYIDSGAIGIGRNQSGIGSGTIAIGVENTWGIGKWNNSYGATLIGSYNKANYNSNLLHGATVVGNNNFLDNYAYGAVMLGNRNRFDQYSGAYGSVLVGINSSIKGAGSIAIGTGYDSGGGGAHARYAAIAISYKGAIASDNAVALGGNGCAAFSGATSIGWCGCMSYCGGISLGWYGVTAQYGSISIGHDGITTLNGGVSIGWNGVCSQYGSIALGYYGAFSYCGSLAIGYSGVNSLYGAIAIGYYHAYADNGGMAFGSHAVKGKNGSIAIGICGTYANTGSIAIGHKAHAMYGGLSVINNTTGGPDFSFEENQNLQFVEYRDADGSVCYPEFRVLKGIPTRVDYIYGADGEVLDTIENPTSGRYSVYKTATGKYYSALRDIPYYDWSKVWIRATRDGNGTIKPFYGMKVGILEAQERVDSWIEVPIRRSGSLQIGECCVTGHPSLSYLEMDCAAYGGSTFGGKAFAKNGAVAIGTDYASGTFYCSDKAVTIDGNECREYTRYAGLLNGTKFYPWNVYQAYANANSVAIGSSVIATGASIAMGIAPVKAEGGSMALGYGASVDWGDLVYGTAEGNSLLICGIDNTDDIIKRGKAKWKSIGIGTGVVATSDSIAIGDRAEADEISSAIGFCSTADNESIAYGDSNHSRLNAIAIGSRNISSGWSIALGVNNSSHDDVGGHATLIGNNNVSTANLEKLEKSIRVKYEKQEALEKEIARYDTVHNKALALVRDYTSSSEYTIYANYEQALYDYYVNGGPNPGYNQSYYDIKNSLVNYPAIIMSSTDWDNWYNGYNYGYYYMAEACDYYQYYLWYQEDYYLDYYREYRDYAYQYLPAWLDLMKTYATNNMTDDYVAILTEIIDAIADRPEIVPMNIFYTGTSGYYQSDYYKLVREFYESYNSRSYATQGRMPNKLQYDYRDYDSESTSLRLIIQNIIRSGSSGVYIDEVEEIPCNSILMGSGNESRHYNSILIGANNRSAAPTSEKSKTDDDGFMLAVGYRNTVGRNYDIAIGYMSEANGGENVAIQHSTAGNGKKSYHNLAMFDSKAYGTGNVALQHAEVKSGYRNLAMFDSTIDAGVLNIVHGNSKLVCTGDGNINNFVLAESTFTGTGGSGGNYIQYNSLFNSEISTSGAMYFSRFFRTNGIVEGGGNGAANSEYFANKDLQLISNSADRNLLFGNISAGLRASSIARNLFFGNDNRYGALGLNATTISDCIISTMHALQFSTGAFTDNVLLDSRLLGNASDFTTNVLLGRSIAELQWTEGLGMPVTYNFLFNARLNLTNHYCSQTVLFDCVASNVYDSFAFGFGDTAEEGLSQGLYDSSRMVTFGDGIIRNSSDTFHFGANNEITSVYDSTVFGRMNTIYGSDIGGATSLGSLRLLGSSNTVNGYAITNTIIGNTNSIYGTSILNHCGADNNIILGNANGIYAQYMVSGNTIIGGGNYITGVTPDVTLIDSAAELNSIDHACMVKVIHDSAVPTGESYTYISSEAYYYYSNGTLTRFYTWTTGLTDVIKATAIVMTGSSLASAFNAGTLQEFTWYYSTSSQSNVSIPEGEMLWNSSSYYYDGTTVTEMESGTNGRYIFRNAIIGDANVIHNNVAGFTVLGGNNTITYTAPRTLDDCISFGLVQGNNNTANDGSNIVCLGNGNRSTGHNSVAIGDQLVSNQWQTVIGKYNSPIEGPNRLDTENPQDASKALFIIGNGYSEKDDADWQKEEYITRSNAMVVYADGTVRAKKFVSDEPELELTAGTGITLTPDMSAGTNTVAVSQDLADFITFLASRPATGRYTINSVDGVLSWVQIGTTQV